MNFIVEAKFIPIRSTLVNTAPPTSHGFKSFFAGLTAQYNALLVEMAGFEPACYKAFGLPQYSYSLTYLKKGWCIILHTASSFLVGLDAIYI